MKTKDLKVLLIMGAYGVGKSTISSLLVEKYKNDYVHINLDNYIARKKKMDIKEYMGKVGYEKFYEESKRCIGIIECNKYKRKWIGKTLLIDIGSGSTFDYRAFELTNSYHSVLLTADPDYIYNTRQKCKESGMRDIGYYKYWQFSKEKDKLYENCSIKFDVAYLTPEQVAEQLNTKIKNFQDGF